MISVIHDFTSTSLSDNSLKHGMLSSLTKPKPAPVSPERASKQHPWNHFLCNQVQQFFSSDLLVTACRIMFQQVFLLTLCPLFLVAVYFFNFLSKILCHFIINCFNWLWNSFRIFIFISLPNRILHRIIKT
jgi:hypothetical protein